MDNLLKDHFEIALREHTEKVAAITEKIATVSSRVDAANQENAGAVAQDQPLAKRETDLPGEIERAIQEDNPKEEKRLKSELQAVKEKRAKLKDVKDRCNIITRQKERFPQMSDQLRFESRACGRFRFFLENADNINAALDAVRDVFNISETTRKDAEILLQDIPIFNSVNLDPRTGRPLQMRLKMPSVYDIEMQQHFHLLVEPLPEANQG